MTRLIMSLAMVSIASAGWSQRLTRPPAQGRLSTLAAIRTSNPWGSLPSGATLVFQFGDVAAAGIRYVDPGNPRVLEVRWDVTKVPRATGIQLQIASCLFAPSPAELMKPHLLVESRPFALPAGKINLDIVPLARRLSSAEPTAPSGGLRSVRSVVRLYIRAVPVAGNPNVAVGQPSNVLEAVYGKEPPSSLPFKISPSPTKVMTKPSGVLVERITYELPEWRCVVHWSLGPCAIGKFKGGSKDPLVDIVSFVTEVWDWVSKQYANVKGKLVDVACGLLPMVPRAAFEAGLDAALASCGLPPNIPNLSAALDGGADYLAGEVVSGINMPVASHIAKEKVKQAILVGAKEAGKHAVAPADTPCDDTIIWKPLLVFVSNLRATDIVNVRIMIMDDKSNFLNYSLQLPRLARGRMIPVVIPMIPNWYRKDLYGSDGTPSEANWWSANKQSNRVTAWIYEGTKMIASEGQPMPVFDRPISRK